jgi:hypothetical protein
MVLIRPECPGDAVASDRILLLTFSEPTAAPDVQAVIQDGSIRRADASDGAAFALRERAAESGVGRSPV